MVAPGAEKRTARRFAPYGDMRETLGGLVNLESQTSA